MPFDDDYEDEAILAKKKLKNVSSQKSIFDNIPKKPNQEQLNKQVENIQETASSFKKRTAELAVSFKKIMDDKTLPQNKSIFSIDMEKETLSHIIQLAAEVNADPDENEGMGSLSWIAQLFKTCLSQRDRMNKMEYAILTLEKKIEKKINDEQVVDTAKSSG